MGRFRNGTATCANTRTAPDPSTRYKRAKRAPAIVSGRHLAAEGRPMTPDHFDDDENVKAMRKTARTVGLTTLLLDVRRSHLAIQTALDRDRARVTQALVLLGVLDEERTA